MLGGILALAAAFAAGWLTRGARFAAPAETLLPNDAAVHEVWASWLSHTEGALLSFSNPPTTSVRQFAGPIVPNQEHQGVPVSPEQDTRFREFFQFKPGGNLYLYPLVAQAKMGEALAAVQLASFFTRAGLPVRAMQSRFMTWETLRQANVILLGHADSNQWVEPVLASAPFTVAATDRQRRARILNRSPRQGEDAEYFPTLPATTKSYALVSMLPGVDGSHELLVIAGLDTSSTTAAAEYLILRDTARELLSRLKIAQPEHRGAWHFQVVLETDVRDTVPVRTFPVAVRVL